MNCPLRLQRAAVWMQTDDNAMWIMLPVLIPLLTVVLIGLIGA